MVTVQVVWSTDDEPEIPEERIPERARSGETGFRRLQVQLLAEEQGVPQGVARYYLEDTTGNVRAAKERHSTHRSLDSELIVEHMTVYLPHYPSVLLQAAACAVNGYKWRKEALYNCSLSSGSM